MIITVPDCSCRPQGASPTGTLPEYHQDENAAQEAFQAHYDAWLRSEQRDIGDPWTRPRYWAVHWRGRHVIATSR